MPRTKLYHTKQQRAAANRKKAKAFYDKNRTKVLEAKKSAREQLLRRLERERLTARKRTEKREKRRKRQVSAKDFEEKQRTLETELESLHSRYIKRLEQNPAPNFYNDLYNRTINWLMLTSRNPLLRTQTLPSPLEQAIRPFERLSKEFGIIEEKLKQLLCEHDYDPAHEQTRQKFFEVGRDISWAVDMIKEMEILGNESMELLKSCYSAGELIYQTHYRCK
ncbi:hypothetical protein V5O48_017233 [Marasmius crinis-equi]|uniref:BZIP domain-containing protein n=1 Tax=Marasmius crinis-equi TaxID=585013 RepID=A0ABR3EPJ8_9AGAR